MVGLAPNAKQRLVVEKLPDRRAFQPTGSIPPPDTLGRVLLAGIRVELKDVHGGTFRTLFELTLDPGNGLAIENADHTMYAS